MAAQSRRIAIGFQGGQVLELRVAEQQLDRLYKALDGRGWHQLETEDGPVHIDLGQVVYVRAENAEHRVGFGA